MVGGKIRGFSLTEISEETLVFMESQYNSPQAPETIAPVIEEQTTTIIKEEKSENSGQNILDL